MTDRAGVNPEDPAVHRGLAVHDNQPMYRADKFNIALTPAHPLRNWKRRECGCYAVRDQGARHFSRLLGAKDEPEPRVRL